MNDFESLTATQRNNSTSITCLDMVSSGFGNDTSGGDSVCRDVPGADNTSLVALYSPLSITLLSIFLGLMTVCGAVGNVSYYTFLNYNVKS